MKEQIPIMSAERISMMALKELSRPNLFAGYAPLPPLTRWQKYKNRISYFMRRFSKAWQCIRYDAEIEE